MYYLLCHESLQLITIIYRLALYYGMVFSFAVNNTKALINICNVDSRAQVIHTRIRCITYTHVSALVLSLFLTVLLAGVQFVVVGFLCHSNLIV